MAEESTSAQTHRSQQLNPIFSPVINDSGVMSIKPPKISENHSPRQKRVNVKSRSSQPCTLILGTRQTQASGSLIPCQKTSIWLTRKRLWRITRSLKLILCENMAPDGSRMHQRILTLKAIYEKAKAHKDIHNINAHGWCALTMYFCRTEVLEAGYNSVSAAWRPP